MFVVSVFLCLRFGHHDGITGHVSERNVLNTEVLARELIQAGNGDENIDGEKIVVDGGDLGRIAAPNETRNGKSHVLRARDLEKVTRTRSGERKFLEIRVTVCRPSTAVDCKSNVSFRLPWTIPLLPE